MYIHTFVRYIYVYIHVYSCMYMYMYGLYVYGNGMYMIYTCVHNVCT